MPKYHFSCFKCASKVQKYVASTVETLPCQRCGETMTRDLPNIIGQTEVKELVDPYTNRKWTKDQEPIMKDRRDQYFRDIEIPRLIQSGTYSIETCLENKWLIYNDKGELVINKNWTRSS